MKIIQDILMEENQGQPPYCLLDFFNKDFLLVIDESHVTLPQVMAMFKGDYSSERKH